MNKYDLIVRGYNIHIEFARINDSRRINDCSRHNTNKRPNLFGIKAAMGCKVSMPLALCPDWCKAGVTPGFGPFPFTGVGFCFHKDKWSPMKGRHRSLADALSYPGCDKELNADITIAFSEEETRRTKVKGPARIPKTAKPKPRRRSTMERIADALEILAHPPMVYSNAMGTPEVLAAFGNNIRPADMPALPDDWTTLGANGTISKGENA
jgi:hypothetical protein